MKKIIIVNGLIAGSIVSAMVLISHPLMEKGVIDMDNGMVIGYASMIISLSMIFFGVKAYRDQYLQGFISFGLAFKMGILITLIASLLYAITWEVYYNTAGANFTEFYTQCYLEKMQKEGATAGQLNEARVEMAEFAEQYKNPFIRFGMTLMEIFPVGLVVTLICAAILRRREVQPAQNQLKNSRDTQS